MKHLINRHAILLATLLQVLPIVRNIATNPATPSTFAIILRWTIGSGAALGAYDAFSAASTPYFRAMQTNIVMTQGVYFSNTAPYSIVVTNIGVDPGAFFTVSNATTHAMTPQLGDTDTSTIAVPAGITIKCVDKASSHYVYLAMYGTPTTVTAKTLLRVEGGYSGNTSVYTNIFVSVVSASSPPAITNQPANVTITAGGTTNFTVLAGSAPLNYQWYFNTNTSLLNATNTSLSLTNIRASQAGTYSVVITNSTGAITSSPALLTVTQPSPPAIGSPGVVGGQFQFTFKPVVGLTNSVLTNSSITGGSWAVLTNVAPPATTNPVTVFDTIGGTNRFYRVQIIP